MVALIERRKSERRTTDRRKRWLRLFAYVLVCGLSVFTAVQQRSDQKKTAALAQKNTEAIRVGCILLTNAILESGAGGDGQAPTSPAAKAQRQITAIYVQVIGRSMTSAEVAEVKRLSKIVAKAGGVVSTPDCNEIAAHPDGVKELLLSKTKDAARRSPAVTTRTRDRSAASRPG